MLLCIDIGNTNIKLGLLDGETIVHSWRISTDRTELAAEYAMLILNLFEKENIQTSSISGCAISSVVPVLTQEFVELSDRYLNLNPVILGPDSVTDMKINTDYPTEVGSDLVMNALGARHLYGAPAIVIGLGTATTFVAISADGNMEGVAISPGIITSANSLSSSTSALPRIALKKPERVIGKNTITALQGGIYFGFNALIDGMVRRITQELGGKVTVVATGGLAEIMAKDLACIHVVEPNLALVGLKILYDKNHPKSI